MTFFWKTESKLLIGRNSPLKWRTLCPSISQPTASSPARRSFLPFFLWQRTLLLVCLSFSLYNGCRWRIFGLLRHHDSVTVLPLPLKADCGRLKLQPKCLHFLFYSHQKQTNLPLRWNPPLTIIKFFAKQIYDLIYFSSFINMGTLG